MLFLPPLRERHEDILLLAHHFSARMAFELGRSEVPEFTPRAVALLEHYGWPGNVRQLKNVVERAVYRSEGRIVSEEEIVVDPFESPYASVGDGRATRRDPPTEPTESADDEAAPPRGPAGATLPETVRDLEVQLLRDGLARAKYNQRKAAEILGLTYHQFRGLYRKHRDHLTT